MAKTTKQSKAKNSGSKRSLARWSTRSKVIAVVTFALITTLLLQAIYASPKKESTYNVELPAEEISLSLTSDKALAAVREEGSDWKFISRGRSIDVTERGRVYCTPEDNGPVRTRQLSATQLKQLKQDVASTDYQESTTDESAQSVNRVGDSKALYVVDGARTRRHATKSDTPPQNFQRAEEVLEQLCKGAQTESSSTDVPAFEVPVDAAPIPSKSSSLGSRIANWLLPKVEAGGTPTNKPTYVMDRATENDQVARINNARASAGIAGMKRLTCLDDAARYWAQKMSSENHLRHSNLTGLINLFCGATFWYNWSGENVGRAADSATTFNLYMQSPDHRQNILRRDFARVGVGAYVRTEPSGAKQVWTAQLFIGCNARPANCIPPRGITY